MKQTSRCSGLWLEIAQKATTGLVLSLLTWSNRVQCRIMCCTVWGGLSIDWGCGSVGNRNGRILPCVPTVGQKLCFSPFSQLCHSSFHYALHMSLKGRSRNKKDTVLYLIGGGACCFLGKLSLQTRTNSSCKNHSFLT